MRLLQRLTAAIATGIYDGLLFAISLPVFLASKHRIRRFDATGVLTPVRRRAETPN